MKSPADEQPDTVRSRPSNEKRTMLRTMFGRIAPGYDFFNSLLSFGQHHRWRRFAARQCCFPPGGLALDVAIGTVDFALEVIGGNGRAIGVDPCEPMMQAGVAKLVRHGATN